MGFDGEKDFLVDLYANSTMRVLQLKTPTKPAKFKILAQVNGGFSYKLNTYMPYTELKMQDDGNFFLCITLR